MPKSKQTLIYRITHVKNLPWIVEHGLHANSSDVRDPGFVQIGNPELIAKRRTREVPIGPCGTLDDYVPFYFGTHSVMLFQLHTRQVPGVDVLQRDIAYVVSSVERILEAGVPFVFTDRHAYVVNAQFFGDTTDLDRLDWSLIRGRDFRHDPEQPDKGDRRMAELLVHRYCPAEAVLGIACYDDDVCMRLQSEIVRRGARVYVKARRDWYFE